MVESERLNVGMESIDDSKKWRFGFLFVNFVKFRVMFDEAEGIYNGPFFSFLIIAEFGVLNDILNGLKRFLG